MLNIFSKDRSIHLAKERLRSVLISDRLHCPNEQICELERDIQRCINKYYSLSPGKLQTRLVQKRSNCEKREFVLIFEATIQE